MDDFKNASMQELLRIQEENFDFLEHPLTRFEDQVWHELFKIEAYYLQREADGELYTSNQKYVIDGTIEEIKDALRAKRIDRAAMLTVALMETMGLSIKLVAVHSYMNSQGISAESLIDVDTYNDTLDNGRGKRR